MDVAAGVIAFFKALPELLRLISKLGQAIEETKLLDWLEELDAATEQVKNAKTLKERVEAARRLTDITKRMR